jgi:riboflavin kinase / FMN adenylyltransferase
VNAVERYTTWSQLSEAPIRRPLAVTIGFFDGVHRGHRGLLAQLREDAGSDGDTLVVTFDPHPRTVLTNTPPATLTSLEQRLRQLEAAGVDHALVLHFDRALASVSAEDFLDTLVGAVRPDVLDLGSNHHFGRGREGDATYVAKRADRYGYRAHRFELEVDGAAISSSRVRACVAQGALEEASRLLGRPYSLRSAVIAGDGRGRQLGFPTANLDVKGMACPPRGVYAALARDAPGSPKLALVNIGRRPTFEQDGRELVEAHLLGFSGDLYGKELELVFLSKLRDERRFASVEELKSQILADRELAESRHLAALEG